jgi:hypothetical protein
MLSTYEEVLSYLSMYTIITGSHKTKVLDLEPPQPQALCVYFSYSGGILQTILVHFCFAGMVLGNTHGSPCFHASSIFVCLFICGVFLDRVLLCLLGCLKFIILLHLLGVIMSMTTPSHAHIFLRSVVLKSQS